MGLPALQDRGVTSSGRDHETVKHASSEDVTRNRGGASVSCRARREVPCWHREKQTPSPITTLPPGRPVCFPVLWEWVTTRFEVTAVSKHSRPGAYHLTLAGLQHDSALQLTT